MAIAGLPARSGVWIGAGPPEAARQASPKGCRAHLARNLGGGAASQDRPDRDLVWKPVPDLHRDL